MHQTQSEEQLTERVLLANRAARLLACQRKVGALLRRIDRADGWSASLTPAQVDELVGAGHFENYGSELAWTPLEVAGHLTDSALIFADRISRLLHEASPELDDFVTDEPWRLDGYRASRPAERILTLERAQTALLRAFRGVAASTLGRSGVHAKDGRVTLEDLTIFLPAHQWDHLRQLRALAEVRR